MASIRPDELVLRCYGHRVKAGKWYGVCLDLNIAAEADSSNRLKDKLNDMISGYLETVLDTEDKESVGALLTRRAPLKDWLTYYYIKLLISTRRLPNDIIFKQFIPFHLAHNC